MWSYTLLTSLRKTGIRRHKGKICSQLQYGYNMACINLIFPISVWMSPVFPRSVAKSKGSKFQNDLLV